MASNMDFCRPTAIYRYEKGSLTDKIVKLFAVCTAFSGMEDAAKTDAGQNTLTQDEAVSLYALAVGELIEEAYHRGFEGNLWHTHLANFLVQAENAYSLSCEIGKCRYESIREAAICDFKILRAMFALDFEWLDRRLGCRYAPVITNYQREEGAKIPCNKRIARSICELAGQLAAAGSETEFCSMTEDFYTRFGCGSFGLHKAFRVRHVDDGAVIEPITNIAHVHLDDLVGYEDAKKKLVENTEAFLAGRPANNCLLFGDAGTGKSSSIKGILNQYYDQGLRMIEIYKHQFRDLNDVVAQIKNRNYKFIIYMDDLSFEDFETDYKYLKAVIEGGLERKPSNILIYATSNRRHLIRENYSDKEEIREDMHTSDTVQEKLSLAYRFGVTIYFGSPDKKEFQNIVKTLAARDGIEMDEKTLLLKANAWELYHGGLSGRTARQFIDYLLGTAPEEV